MKTLLISVLLMVSTAVEARVIIPCLQGNRKIETIEQLDDLVDDLDAAGVGCVNGSIWIFGVTDLEELDLGPLARVSGFLIISSNPFLTNIVAPNLVKSAGMIIVNNPELSTCVALAIKNQTRVGTWYMIGGNGPGCE